MRAAPTARTRHPQGGRRGSHREGRTRAGGRSRSVHLEHAREGDEGCGHWRRRRRRRLCCHPRLLLAVLLGGHVLRRSLVQGLEAARGDAATKSVHVLHERSQIRHRGPSHIGAKVSELGGRWQSLVPPRHRPDDVHLGLLHHLPLVQDRLFQQLCHLSVGRTHGTHVGCCKGGSDRGDPTQQRDCPRDRVRIDRPRVRQGPEAPRLAGALGVAALVPRLVRGEDPTHRRRGRTNLRLLVLPPRTKPGRRGAFGGLHGNKRGRSIWRKRPPKRRHGDIGSARRNSRTALLAVPTRDARTDGGEVRVEPLLSVVGRRRRRPGQRHLLRCAVQPLLRRC
mmetsp:Transcript_12756/g.42024  ORF Transcript_12756/g.42024 Transcript_12756/m.42024 type:complete len:337 (-) Transcript_12756:1448-2458(-)